MVRSGLSIAILTINQCNEVVTTYAAVTHRRRTGDQSLVDINTYTEYDSVYNPEYGGSDGRVRQWGGVKWTVCEGLEVDVS
jgi:hypothetical protein